MIPDGWMLCDLDRCVEAIIDYRGKSVPKAESGVPLITARNVREGCLDFSEMEYISQDDYQAWTSRGNPNPNDVLFTTEAPLGSAALFPAGRYVIGQRVVVLQPRLRTTNATYLMYYLLSPAGKMQIALRSSGTTATGIKQSELRKISVLLPIIEEQDKIAAILTTWDRAIELTEKLIAAKQQRKRALMQQLLTGRARLPGFSSRWDIAKTGELFKPVSVKNHPDERVLSVTQDMGVVYRDQMDRKIGMSLDNTGGYKLVRPGDFIISLRSFQGGLEMSRVRGIVSPAYHVIHPVVEIDRDFFRHYFKSAEFIARLAVAVIGIRDGKQISFEDFGFMKCRLPPLEEQSAIAAVLNTQDREIELHQQKLDALRRQKKGLMQQLLTGKLRVNVPTDAPEV